MAMVGKDGGPSFVPLDEQRLRTMILDRQHNKIEVFMERMKACWMELGVALLWMGGWT